MIFRLMIGETSKSKGFGRSELEDQRSSGDWIIIAFETEAPERKQRSGKQRTGYWPGSRTPKKRMPDSSEKSGPNRGAAGASLRTDSRFCFGGVELVRKAKTDVFAPPKTNRIRDCA